MTLYTHHSRLHQIFFLPRTRLTVGTIHAMIACLVAAIFGYGYMSIASAGLSYHIQREWKQAEIVIESQRALENAYAEKLETLRSGGEALGLVASPKPYFIESYSSVAKADL